MTKAIICREHGSPKRIGLEEQADAPLQAGQVRVAVNRVGVSYVDGLLITGDYQIKIPTPFIPGSDLSGNISEVGENVSHFSVGDPVIASVGIGALTESIVLSPSQLTKAPEAMTHAMGATFFQNNSTAHYALVTLGKVCAGETVLVLGAAGGTGTAAVHIAKAMGAQVIAAASSAEKLEACVESGADTTINYAIEDLKQRAKELTHGRGVDLVFDPVAGDLAEPALRSCAPGGRYLVIGFVGGAIPKVPLNLPLIKRCSILGVNWGADTAADPSILKKTHASLLKLFGEGKLPEPRFTEFAFADAGNAIASLHERRAIGRAVVKVA